MPPVQLVGERDDGQSTAASLDSTTGGVKVFNPASESNSFSWKRVNHQGYRLAQSVVLTLASSTVAVSANLLMVTQKLLVWHTSAVPVWLTVNGTATQGTSTASAMVPIPPMASTMSQPYEIEIASSPGATQVSVILDNGTTSSKVYITGLGNTTT